MGSPVLVSLNRDTLFGFAYGDELIHKLSIKSKIQDYMVFCGHSCTAQTEKCLDGQPVEKKSE